MLSQLCDTQAQASRLVTQQTPDVRMQEAPKPEEEAAAAPAPAVDFTPTTAAVEEEKPGFDPTQYVHAH